MDNPPPPPGLPPRPPEQEEWSEQQAVATGECTYCQEQEKPLRIEPFGRKLACRRCWEQICYGDWEDD